MRYLSSFCTVAFAVLVSASAWGQDQAGDSGVDRSPHFLLASASGHERVRVDVALTPSLRRRISVDLEGVTLKDALTEISERGNLRLLYSRDVVPLDALVRLKAENITVAGALSEVLLDAGVDVLMSPDGRAALVKRGPAVPVAAGSIVGRVTDAKTKAPLAGATVVVDGTSRSGTAGTDGHYRIADVAPGTYTLRARYIGYAPATASVTVSADQEATADFGLEKSAQKLDEVVTTGTIVPTELKASPNPVSVVTGDEIRERNLRSVDQIFRGMVPGAAAFDLGVYDYFSSIATRGANQVFGAGTPKTYIDGVEVTDLLQTALVNIDPNSIDRVEVIRGPEGSTVYGSNASGGVVQIFTKKGTASQRPELDGTAMVGAVQGPSTVGTPLRQNYALSLTGGKPEFSYNLGGSYARTGETAPTYYSRTPSFFGGASLTQGPMTIGLSARYAERTWTNPFDPRFALYPPFSKPSNVITQDFHQTYGLTTSYAATSRWQHNVILGYDSEQFPQWQTQPQLLTPADTFLFYGNSIVSQASIRYNTSYNVPVGPTISMVATAGAEYYRYGVENPNTFGATKTSGSLDGTSTYYRAAYSNSGYFSQLLVGIRDRLFLTGGLRAERNDNFGDAYGTAWQPRVGAAYVQPLGEVSLKLRGSWGNAIRGVSPQQKEASISCCPTVIYLANPALRPERQSGWDAGLDLQVGTRGSLGVTYYDQDAKDLIDNVLLASGDTVVRQNQNTGVIKNRGWEFEGRLDLGEVNLSATFSPVSSTVRQLSPTYTGTLRVGDHPHSVPKNTGGATLRWTPRAGTTAILGMTYIGPWTDFDILSYFAYAFGGAPYRGSFRAYYIEYPSVTKFNLSLAQRVTRQVSALVQVDNLGNNTRYESQNYFLRLGRVTSVGFRFQY